MQSKAVLIHAIGDACMDHGFRAMGSVDGTMSVVLLTAECINITSNKLPLVRQYSQAIVTERATTLTRYMGNDWPNLSPPTKKKKRQMPGGPNDADNNTGYGQTKPI